MKGFWSYCRIGLILSCFGALAGSAQTTPVLFETENFAVETAPWVHPSWRDQTLTVTFFAVNRTDNPIKLELTPSIRDVRTDDIEPVTGVYAVELEPRVSREVAFTMPATGLETWSHWDPRLYTMDIAISANDVDVGEMPRVRFGYREMWVENGYFYINGKRVFLRGGNHGGRRNPTEVEGALYARFNADTIRGDDNRPLGLSDEAGIYLFYFGTPGLTEEWKRYSYRFANHPSVVGFAGWSQGYYPGPHGHPLMLGAEITDELREEYRDEHPAYFELPKQINEMYPGWLYAHYVRGIGGNFRSLMWDLNYSVPMQSQEEWMKVWRRNRDRVEPFFPQEFALNRYGADQMRMDRRGGLSVLVENTARFFGDESYRMFHEEDIDSYTPESLERHPANMADSSPLFYRMKSYVYGRVVPAWRTWGNAHMLMHVDGHPGRIRGNSSLADVFRPIFAELYFFLGGPEDDFTDKDNAFYPGEPISKSGIIINDTETAQTLTVTWQLTDAGGEVVRSGLLRRQQAETIELTVGQGEVAFVPISLTAPAVDEKATFEIHAECRDADGNLVLSDVLALRVFPEHQAASSVPVLLIDATGHTERMLNGQDIAFTSLATDGDGLPSALEALDGAPLLLVGRESYPAAVKLLETEAAQAALRGGMNIVVLEQMNRSVMGLTLDQTNSRETFVRDPGHALLAGLDHTDMSEWRGESSMFPSYPSFDEDSLWYWHGYSYQGQYTSFRHRRAWYWSNKAMVSTFCYEKPQFGNFRILVDAWYDLLGTPLVEFQVGRGRILFCQLDMTDHVGNSPVARLLMDRILDEYAKPAEHELLPVGALSAATVELLGALRMASSQGIGGKAVLLTPADLDALSDAQQRDLADFVRNGGSVLASVETAAQAAKLPTAPVLGEAGEGVWNPVFPDHAVFGGLGPSELFLREPQAVARVTGFEGARESAVNADGIAGAASYGDGLVVVLQVPADKFADAGRSDFSGRSKVLRMYVSILTKLGGLSEAAPDPALIGGWGHKHEWMPGFSDRVERGAPRVRRSPLYERPALDWDPDAHVSF